MLNFFIRYQKKVVLITTSVILVSFIFFGTYRAVLPSGVKQHKKEEVVLYTTLKGRKVTESYLEKMKLFLENEPTFSYDMRKIIDSNPLNDGVLTKDFLVQGFIDLLLTEEGKKSLEKKFQAEKATELYTHPVMRELSTVAIWQQYSPELLQEYINFQKCPTALSKEALVARSHLYLAHQRFNGDMLKQLLRYQEYQSSVQTDPLLANKELSLFGYRNLSDWFGEESVRQAAKIVIHGAQMAKVSGLKVTKEEVRTDLYGRAQSAFTQLQKRGELPVQNGSELVRLVGQRLQIDENDLLQVWEDVLYFRRLLDERSASVLVDSLALEEFAQFAHQSVTVQMTHMAKELALHSMDELKGFELYIEHVGEKRDSLLSLPKGYRSSESIAMQAPELLGRRYWVQVAHVEKKELSSKVSLSKLWAWQQAHQKELQERFGLPAFEEWDQISEAVRGRVDDFSYHLIIDQHPEWIEEALAEKVSQEKELFIRFSQKAAPLEGITELAALREKLDHADKIALYSQDGEHYYRFVVSQRGFVGEILSYKEALRIGAIADLKDRLCGHKRAEEVVVAIEEFLRASGVAVPTDEKEKFCVERRFYSYLSKASQDTDYLEGMDVFYAPRRGYKTFTRVDEHFEKAMNVEEGVVVATLGEEEGLFFYQVDSQGAKAKVALDKYLLLHHLASQDVRSSLLKEIAGAL